MEGRTGAPESASEAVETWHRNMASTRRGPPSSTALLKACRAVLVTCGGCECECNKGEGKGKGEGEGEGACGRRV